tara:strand:- start:1 stop:309 length:309 start_codon:yes stop_codon:yes gene_type:complete
MARFNNVNGIRIQMSTQEELELDAIDAAWEAGADARAAEDVRNERNGLLLEVDAYVSNPLRWASLTPAVQALWATYRQELLGVPQQTGFPQTVTWPTQPEVI